MNRERLEKIDEVFAAALDLKSAHRAAFIREACKGDPELRSEVESLVAADERASDFIEDSAAQVAAELLSSEQDLPGQTVGDYKVLSPLGAGGMGEIYLAEDSRLGRKVALKLLPASFTASEERVQRFRQEARAASRLNHPNILTVYEVGRWMGRDFIAAEYVEGMTLRAHMSGRSLSIPESLEIVLQVAAALSAAHGAGIVHRDVKPENVMIRSDGYVKVLDFGIAKLMEDSEGVVSNDAPTRLRVETAEGIVIGTASYMSPEQARGLKVDARTDIWSCGVMVYEMLSGQMPFIGGSAAEVVAQILDREPAPVARYVTDPPVELQRIIGKALTKNRDERYQTIKDMLLDLKALKQELEFAAKLQRSISHGESGGLPGNGVKIEHGSRTNLIADTRPASSAEYIVSKINEHKRGAVITASFLLLAVIGLAYWFFVPRPVSAIESIAVLPFVNASGNADVEYLSDGMSESLINSLSELPHLSVKARSSVFQYKGKEIQPQRVAADLSVQAILSGHVVQRGDDLTLYLSLVDGRNGNQLWGQQYNRKLTDLVTLQNEIARDVSQKLRIRLSLADEQKLAKKHTENVEAYQLYLRGRYHIFKHTLPEIQTGVSYFQKAIESDPSYALAYVGLADAYRLLALPGEMPATELLPQAKAAAQKAVEIDDALAEAHAILGFMIFWYDWDWGAAENQLKRALELDPNSADAHEAYSHLLFFSGRHEEGLAEIKRATDLDPLNVRFNSIEGAMLIYSGRPDEALSMLQKTLELEPTYWFARQYVASAYIEKGMFAEAVAEARKARESSGVSTRPTAFLGYALAKSGRRAEARAELEALLKLSSGRYVSPYNIAMIYNGLGERDETLAWLERGYREREPRMIFLRSEPKWNNLRDDAQFQELLRRIGFPP